MEESQIRSAIESILFVAGDALLSEDIAAALEEPEDRVRSVLAYLAKEYENGNRGVRLTFIDGKAQLCTNPGNAEYVRQFFSPLMKRTLSQSVLETLAVIAFRQPVTRIEVEEVRGIQCSYSIQILMERGLIECVGRKEALGRPMLYATTDEFLRRFGLESIKDLPDIESFDLPAMPEE